MVTDGNCNLPGGVEPNSSAFHVVQSRDQVLIVRENPGLPRTIYMDGRAHPDLSRLTPTAVGHSTGRYEAGALVVETIGLATGNVTAGGWRTPETRLVERYRLSSDGRRLTISYTWQDPKVYVKPHTLRDRGRAHPARQLGVRVVVRLERPQSATLDRSSTAEQVTP